MEVVMVSMYVTPVASSLMMWLVLIVETPGVTTSPMGMVAMGAWRSTATSSGICKQAGTPEKTCGGVGGHMSANACAGEEGLGGVGVLGGEDGGFMGIIWESWLDPTFGLEALDGWGISLVATTGWDGCSTFSHPKNFGALLSRVALAHRAPWGHLQWKGSSDSPPLPSWGGPSHGRPFHRWMKGTTSPPPSASSHFLLTIVAHLQQVDYFLHPVLEGHIIWHHLLPRDFPYIPTCIQRHGSMEGAWSVASLTPNSCICHGSPKDACTSLPIFLQSSIPGTVNNLVHHSGVLHLLVFHGTYWLNSNTTGSGGIFLPSSSEVSGDPLRKEATISLSSGGSSKSEPSSLVPSSLGPAFGSAGWLGAGWSSNHTWQHVHFCSSLLHPQQSLLLDLALSSKQFQVQFSLSISSSSVASAASTYWWASNTMARLLSTESSFFPLWGVLLLEEWGPSGWGLAMAAGAFSSSHPWWSGWEDSTSSSIAGSPGGDPGSLCNLETSKYSSSSSSLHVSGPTSWTVGMPTSGFSWGKFCWQPQWPQQMICSVLFCPSVAACWNISCSITKQCGLSSAHLSWIPRKSSTFMILSISLTDLCSSAAHHLGTWNFSLLLLYSATISLW